MRRADLLFACAGLALPACFFISDFDGLSGGPDEAAGGSGGQSDANSESSGGAGGAAEGGDSDASVNCNGPLIKLCSGVPAAPPGFSQVVDGLDDEFCQVPLTLFLPELGRFQTCGAEGQFIDNANASVAARVVWSTSGIHYFIHIQKDPSIPIVIDTDQLYSKDAIEIFFGNTATPTGPLAADHAVHLIITPPGADGQSPAFSVDPPATIQYVSVLANGGYDVEFEIPWSELGGPAPVAGNVVVLNIGVDITGPNDERYQSFMHYLLPDGGEQFCKDTSKPTPDENTLTWCVSELL